MHACIKWSHGSVTFRGRLTTGVENCTSRAMPRKPPPVPPSCRSERQLRWMQVTGRHNERHARDAAAAHVCV